MAKTTAPLLSFDATGQVARTQVYSRWRGVPYVRRYVVPANPNTSGQQSTRDIFRLLNHMWVNAPPLLRAPWTLYATGRAFTDRNAFIGSNLKAFRSPTPAEDMEDFVGSPGARGGLPIAGMDVTPGDGTLTVEVTPSPVPDGWSIVAARGVAFLDQDPQAPWAGIIESESDLTDPYSLAFTGLDNDADYVVSAWLEWEKPNGALAYSVSRSEIGTPAA